MTYEQIVKYLDTIDLDSEPIKIDSCTIVNDPLMFVEVMKMHVESIDKSKRRNNIQAIAAKDKLKKVVDFYKAKEKKTIFEKTKQNNNETFK